MKIYFFNVEKWEKDYLEENFKNLEPTLVYGSICLENANKYQDAEVISIFLGSKINKELLDKLPNLKHIATRSTGFDHINLTETEKRKIIVSNVPFYGENTVAEQAFALILALSRKIFQSFERTEKFKFDFAGLMGFDLKDKTLGIVGMGHIGQYTARYGNGFGMKVIASDPNKNEKLAKEFNFKYVDSLEDLLKQSDVITLHAPYNKHTHHLINMDNIKLIKPGAILINTARGGLVETGALIWALENKILSGAGLDVLEGEPEIKEEWEVITKDFDKEQLKNLVMNHVLIERDDVIITPHNAFNTREAINRILETTQKNIRAFIKGESKNVVKPK